MLFQDQISARGVAIQCRITTENPERNFAPDTGVLSVYRHSAGFGMRQDGIGYSGMTITPYYDSLLVKYAHAHQPRPSHERACPSTSVPINEDGHE